MGFSSRIAPIAFPHSIMRMQKVLPVFVAAMVAACGGGSTTQPPLTCMPPKVLLNGICQDLVIPPVDSASLSGVVRDESNDQPVPGAVVTLGNVSATTGQDGRFSLPKVPAGAHDLRVTAAAFTDFNRSVTLPPNGSVFETVALWHEKSLLEVSN